MANAIRRVQRLHGQREQRIQGMDSLPTANCRHVIQDKGNKTVTYLINLILATTDLPHGVLGFWGFGVVGIVLVRVLW